MVNTGDHQREWVTQLKARGLAHTAHHALTIIAPLGAVAAQLLYVFQPFSGVLGWRTALTDIAQALETPDGIEALLRELSADNGAVPGDDPHQ